MHWTKTLVDALALWPPYQSGAAPHTWFLQRYSKDHSFAPPLSLSLPLVRCGRRPLHSLTLAGGWLPTSLPQHFGGWLALARSLVLLGSAFCSFLSHCFMGFDQNAERKAVKIQDCPLLCEPPTKDYKAKKAKRQKAARSSQPLAGLRQGGLLPALCPLFC